MSQIFSWDFPTQGTTSPERNGRQVIPAEFHEREAPAPPISFAFDRSAKASVPPGIQRRSKVFGLTTGSWAPLSAVAQDQCDAWGSSWRSEQDREGDCLEGHGGEQFQHVLAVLICGYRCMKIAPPHPPLPFQLSSPTIPIFKCEVEQAKLQERGCVRIGPDLADWPPFHQQKPCLGLFHPAHTFRVGGERERDNSCRSALFVFMCLPTRGVQRLVEVADFSADILHSRTQGRMGHTGSLPGRGSPWEGLHARCASESLLIALPRFGHHSVGPVLDTGGHPLPAVAILVILEDPCFPFPRSKCGT